MVGVVVYQQDLYYKYEHERNDKKYRKAIGKSICKHSVYIGGRVGC